MLLLPSLPLSPKIHSTLALALTLLAASATRGVATTYDFQTIDDSLASKAGGTNPRGISGSNIVGYYNDSDNVTHGFVFDGTNFTDIDDPFAGTGQDQGTSAQAIDGANIAGYFYDAQENNYGFIYNGADYSNFTLKNGPKSTYISGISGKNLVGVYENSSTQLYHGYFYNGTSSQSTDLDDPKADVIGDTYPQAVQGKIVVGYYNTSGGNSVTSHGFLYNGTAFTTLDDPNAGPFGTCAEGIFNGTIVGFYYDDDGDAHGFIYDGTHFSDLDVTDATQTFAYGINNGDIVGDYYDSDQDVHGFLATPVTANVTAAITSDPLSTTIFANANATFTITYTGVPVPDIQWQASTTAGATWSNITHAIDGGIYSGFNTATLTLIAGATGDSGIQYRAVVTNSGGSAYSTVATLTVNPNASGIVINNLRTNLDTNQQFSGITYVLAKQPVILTVSATGPGTLSYQWFVKGKAVSKATAANFTVSPFAAANAGNYTVVIHSNQLTSNTTSSVIPLALGVIPAFPKPPVNATAASGAKATFTSIPAGAPTPDVQWQVSSNGGKNWADLFNVAPYSGADTSTLTVTANSSLNNYQYRAEANNIFNTVDSKAATLTVTAPPLASSLQGTYKIQTINVALGPFGSNITLPSAAKSYSLKLTSTGLAGVSTSVADKLVATLGQGSSVTVTPTSSTTTTYNANITGTVAFALGDAAYSIVLDNTSTVSASFDKSNNLVVTANLSGAATANGSAIPGTVAITAVVTLAK
jgi:hypothetical protein